MAFTFFSYVYGVNMKFQLLVKMTINNETNHKIPRVCSCYTGINKYAQDLLPSSHKTQD